MWETRKIGALCSKIDQISTRHCVNMYNSTDPIPSEKPIKTNQVVWNALKKCWISNGRIKFIITALGIFGSFFVVGILQEMIMRGCYGSDVDNCKQGERFKHATTTVLVKCLCGLVFVQGIPINKQFFEKFFRIRFLSISFLFHLSSKLNKTREENWYHTMVLLCKCRNSKCIYDGRRLHGAKICNISDASDF